MTPEEQADSGSSLRIIKRYSNRKLYDTTDSRYVTLRQIGEMVRRREHVQIIDNKTKEDKTEVTLALIISEELKNKPSSVPLGTLRSLIQERGERVLSSLRESPLGRLIPSGEEGEEGEQLEADGSAVAATADGETPDGSGDQPKAAQPKAAQAKAEQDKAAEPTAAEGAKRGRLEELVESSKQTLDQMQANFDERVRAAVPGLGLIRDLREEVASLTRRVETLEAQLGIATKQEDDS